ncbi:MAG: GNAT family N-acetyltransferase [Rhodocyclales bacterium GT-UBC]|nr:MAG: GNAT family N-acetyltransferase [Rhodocyclales bacterium GT-UBC]
MTCLIKPTEEADFRDLHRLLDVIARERQFLAIFQAPPFAQSQAFYRRVIDNDLCQFVASQAGSVVGWCDILPCHGEARAHVGTLGMGVLPQMRGQGIGHRLIERALDKALKKGIYRVELNVRSDNTAAISLYQQFGFQIEGQQRAAYRVGEKHFDGLTMARLSGLHSVADNDEAS